MFGTNWTAVYFNNTDLSGTPVYTEIFPNGINVNWGWGSPSPLVQPDYFSVRFTSEQFFEAAVYEFVVSSDAGLRFYIDDRLILDQFIERILTTDRFRLNLAEGIYHLKVEYFAASGQAAIQVQWFAVGYVEGAQLFPQQHLSREQGKSSDRKNVFIVHGHDEVMREQVKTYIREIGYTPIVLHERPNLGRTIIEKFEQEAGNADFAIVLLSPDDVGAEVTVTGELAPRARQNVIAELGYFLAKLGRQRICLLYKKGVEIPSDIFGVLYIPFDTAEEWKRQLIREMQAAGI